MLWTRSPFATGVGGALRDAALEDHAVDLDGIFIEQRIPELRHFLCESDGVHRGEFPVDFEDDVDVFSGTFAHRGDVVYGVGDESFEGHGLEADGGSGSVLMAVHPSWAASFDAS